MEITDEKLDEVWGKLTSNQEAAGDPANWIEGALWRADDPDDETRQFLRFIAGALSQ